MPRINEFGQSIGDPVRDWSPPPAPPREAIDGRLCRLVPLEPATHAEPLFAAVSREVDASSWTYLPYGPFDTLEAYRAWLIEFAASEDPLFFAIERRGQSGASGLASFLRIAPAAGSIEVGHLYFSGSLRRSAAATEAMYLMMRRVFELGYRRYEWKCDSLNAPSRASAERLGFAFEGTFRQAAVYKGRSRDTAWYSILDREWPRLKAAFERWLAPENFDAAGLQRIALRDLMREVRESL